MAGRYWRHLTTVLQLSLFVILLACMFLLTSVKGAIPISVIQRATAATVRVTIPDGEREGIGSGVVIQHQGASSYVLTCAHLFKGNGPWGATVDTFAGDSRRFDASLVKGNHALDVAILRTARLRTSVVEISLSDLSEGQELFTVGCRLGADPTHFVMRLRSNQAGVLWCSRRPAYGRSGGGLFDRYGQLVGVCRGRAQDEDEGLYAGRPSIHKMLIDADIRLPGQPQHIVTAYSASYCGPCRQFEQTLDSARWRQLGVVFDVIKIDKTERPVPSTIEVTPDFAFGDRQYRVDHTDGKYSEDHLHSWLRKVIPTGYTRQRQRHPTHRQHVQATPRTEPPTPSNDGPAHGPILDLPWEGLRFVGVVAEPQDLEMSVMGATVRRIIEWMSGGEATLELVVRTEQPKRYEAVLAAGGWSHELPIFGFVLVDKVAEVGFVKHRLLRRLQIGIRERINHDEMTIPLFPLFRRSHDREYNKVVAALTTEEDPKPEVATVPVPVVVEEPEDEGFWIIDNLVIVLIVLVAWQLVFQIGHFFRPGRPQVVSSDVVEAPVRRASGETLGRGEGAPESRGSLSGL